MDELKCFWEITGKSADINGVHSECGELGLSEMLKICKKAWREEHKPEDWIRVVIVPLHKGKK